MPKLIPMCGLPRTGSTLLVNVLGQNPNITISPDSQLSGLLHDIQNYFADVVSESQYKSDQTYDLFNNFCKSGVNSWMETICNTDYYLDKCRSWGFNFDFLFNLYPNIKVIYTIRDLRGIISSLEKISSKTFLPKELYYDCDNFNYCENDLMEKRVDWYFEMPMIKKSLICLKELMDLERKYFNNIKIIKYENFVGNPHSTLEDIYKHIEMRNYNHDLNNITQGYYHDCVFLPYGRHKINNRLTSKNDDFSIIKPNIQKRIVDKYEWFYHDFYPEILT